MPPAEAGYILKRKVVLLLKIKTNSTGGTVNTRIIELVGHCGSNEWYCHANVMISTVDRRRSRWLCSDAEFYAI